MLVEGWIGCHYSCEVSPLVLWINSLELTDSSLFCRKISAHEFERGGLLKPIVNTIDGTPTFLSISPQNESSSGLVQNQNGMLTNSITGIGRPQRLSRSELKQLDEKELIFELVSSGWTLKIRWILNFPCNYRSKTFVTNWMCGHCATKSFKMCQFFWMPIEVPCSWCKAKQVLAAQMAPKSEYKQISLRDTKIVNKKTRILPLQLFLISFLRYFFHVPQLHPCYYIKTSFLSIKRDFLGRKLEVFPDSLWGQFRILLWDFHLIAFVEKLRGLFPFIWRFSGAN